MAQPPPAVRHQVPLPLPPRREASPALPPADLDVVLAAPGSATLGAFLEAWRSALEPYHLIIIVPAPPGVGWRFSSGSGGGGRAVPPRPAAQPVGVPPGFDYELHTRYAGGCSAIRAAIHGEAGRVPVLAAAACAHTGRPHGGGGGGGGAERHSAIHTHAALLMAHQLQSADTLRPSLYASRADVEAALGDKAWCIAARGAACRSYGFLVSRKRYVLTLEADCRAAADPHGRVWSQARRLARGPLAPRKGGTGAAGGRPALQSQEQQTQWGGHQV
jgi:hypothetical protein